METEQLPGYKRAVRIVFAALAAAYFSCVVIQVFLAGMGTFIDTADWEFHRKFVGYFEFAAPVMFLLSFVGRIRGSARWISLGLYVLTSLQYMTVEVFDGVWVLSAFHTIIALLLFWGSMHVMKRAFRLLGVRGSRKQEA